MAGNKVVRVFKDQAVKSSYDWKVVICDNGSWGYTTSKINEGDTVEIELRDTEFKYYVKRGSINAK